MPGTSRIRRAALSLKPPRARKKQHSFFLHGREHMDEYAYLRDLDDAGTRQYIEAETEYFNACMAPLSDFRNSLYGELKSRLIEDDVSVPETIRGHRYYTRIASGQQYPVHCRVRESGVVEEVYLDENTLAAEHRYCDVSLVAICPRHEKFAFAVDRVGDERYGIFVASFTDPKRVQCVEQAGDSVAWSGDGQVLIHSRCDRNARPDSVWAYDLASGARRELYVEPDAAFHVSVWSSRCGRWILIDTAGNTSSETRALPAADPLSEPVVVIPRREDVEYSVEPHQDRFLVLTNDEAENFRLVAVRPPPHTGEMVEELIPARRDASLEFVDAYDRHLVIGERRHGVEYTWVWDLVTGLKRSLPGAGPMSCHDVEDLYDYQARYVRYEYSSPVRPHGVYDFDVAGGESVLRKTSSPPGYDEDRYACERVNVRSGDVEVPLTLVFRKQVGQSASGAAPVLLTGYGAYEESLDMDFDSDLISLMDRGVIVAMAHVRGGGDLGPAWHDAGRLSRKENSFKDFIACAHYLVEHRYTKPGLIAAWGGSAGALLAAVAAHRHPELFASVVLEVPFLDVVNTLLDRDLPLTEHDFDEFGDPSVKEEFLWLRAYSPYDNIRPQAYPPMLLVAATHDQRVGCWEALKWAARLRANRTDDNPVLVKIDGTGHLGESGRYESVNESAIVYTFLLDLWGLSAE